jgi:hypothetical protein
LEKRKFRGADVWEKVSPRIPWENVPSAIEICEKWDRFPNLSLQRESKTDQFS